MKSGKPKERLWNFVFTGLFLVIGTVCLWLGRRREYDFHMAAWGLCWLVLAAVMAGLTLREYRREVPRNLQPLAAGLAYALLAGAHLERGLGTGRGFDMAACACWLILAAAWLVRAVRSGREESS